MAVRLRDGGGRPIDLELLADLSAEEIYLATAQAWAERAASLQRGAPGADSIQLLEPGRREIDFSILKRRVLSIDGEPFDQTTTVSAFRARWNAQQWATLIERAGA